MTIHERFPFKWVQNRPPKKDSATKPSTTMIIHSSNDDIKLYLYSDFLEREVEMLGLSHRSELALKRRSVNTLQDIVDNWEQIHTFKNIGTKSVTEIKSKFVENYLEWTEKNHPELLNVA